MAEAEEFAAVLRMARALDELGVPYFVGGSFASSHHGLPRSTQDADVVADLREEHVGPLLERLRGEFYVDDERARDAVARRASFNVIHLATMFKVDLFVLADEPHAREELARRQPLALAPGTLAVASAEDTLLHKLRWYRLGGGASERQWGDALGILKVQGRLLDRAYLDRWAADLGVADLLARAFAEAGIESG
jgi:hypothetical protein